MKIIFFGNPKFAAETLDHLHKNHLNIISVVTSPDQKKGRGRKIIASNVKDRATKLNIKVLTPLKLNDEKLVKELKKLNADLFVVVAFRILPESVWNIPKMGTINLHTSLLPNYKGASPINWVLINGENYTGITTFFINNNIDSGKIIMQKKIEICEDMTAAQLHNVLLNEGNKILIQTIKSIKEKTISTSNQNNLLSIKSAPKLMKSLRKIDWNKSAKNIHNLIRGLSPFLGEEEILKEVSICPGAWFIFKTSEIKEIRTKLILSRFNTSTNNKKMNIETDNKSFLKINLLNGSIFIEQIQLSGGKIINISQFLSGNKIDSNWTIK